MDPADCNILIVEDDPVIAADLRSLLRSNNLKVIGNAYDGLMALDMLNNHEINFVILDIDLGTGPSGLDVAQRIHEVYHIPYIFLTSFDDENTFVLADQYAPYGYLVKPYQERSLLTTIKLSISNYTKSQSPFIIEKSALESSTNQYFSKEEFDIICQLLEGKTYSEISQNSFISVNTVKYHCKKIYNKLDIQNRVELSALLLIS